MKERIFIIGIALTILLIGIVSAETVVTAEEPTFWEILTNFFRSLEFTIVGVDVGASVYPDNTWDNIPPGSSLTLYASSKCSSGHGLFDVYANNYIPKFEMKDKLYFNCGVTNTKCIVELYCMPRDFCSYDSDCPSGYKCITKNAVDPYMPLKDADTGATITSYKYCSYSTCTEPSKTCWRVGAYNTCESSTYSCSYSTYQTIVNTNCAEGAGSFIYGSLSACQSNILTDTTDDDTTCKTSGQSCLSDSVCCSGLTCQNFGCYPAIACGNEICESGETMSSCPEDCGTDIPVCGNGVCELGETLGATYECAQDCGTGTETDCKSVGQSCLSDSVCCSGDCFLFQCIADTTDTTDTDTTDTDTDTTDDTTSTDTTGNQRGVDKSTLIQMTISDLLGSVCVEQKDCELNSSCQSLQSLVVEGALTDIQAQSIANSVADKIESIGKWGGTTTAVIACGSLLITTGPGVIPICGAVGALTYYGLDNWFEGLSEKSLSKTGVCIKSSSYWCSFASPLGFIPITKNKCTDGTIILGAVLFFIIIIILKK